jgi:hypothetical protein
MRSIPKHPPWNFLKIDCFMRISTISAHITKSYFVVTLIAGSGNAEDKLTAFALVDAICSTVTFRFMLVHFRLTDPLHLGQEARYWLAPWYNQRYLQWLHSKRCTSRSGSFTISILFDMMPMFNILGYKRTIVKNWYGGSKLYNTWPR